VQFLSPRVLVGIVTRNRGSILRKAVQSALSQRGCELRVAVIDDGSTDETLTLASQFPMVDWTRWTISQGHLAARNHWMCSTREDYFVSLDDDAWFLEGDEIAIAIDVLEKNPQIGAVAFDILSPDRPNPTLRDAPRPAALYIGCGHVLRLAAVRNVGAYQWSPGNYGSEEKDLSLRLMDAGYQIVRLPGLHVWHDKTPLARAIPEQHKSGVCNDLAMTLRRTPAPLLPAALLAKLYRHFIFSRRSGLTNPCLQGFWLFIRSIPAIWHSRRAVKASTLRNFIRLSQA